jgi:hypothetical protein
LVFPSLEQERILSGKVAQKIVSPQGGETYNNVNRVYTTQINLIPGRGRSKVRRCVLAQDGHSLGEEAIYQALWRTGTPESADPQSSRTNRLGAAEIGFKVNMAKKNVRQKISRLFEKLAIEILEDFGTVNSQARLYRIFSYKQILERRRAAGLEDVLRNKEVVFCNQDGDQIVLSPVNVSSSGGNTLIRPAPPKKRRVAPKFTSNPIYPEVPPQEEKLSDDTSDLQIIIDALNRYWPVDQAAAVQLLRDCRRVRPDARADEIAFFVHEKLDLARTNRNITNPTGLIIATVPQSFVGPSLEEFRKRMERHARFAKEEVERRQKEEEDLNVWLLKHRDSLVDLIGDTSRSDEERAEAERQLRQYGFSSMRS